MRKTVGMSPVELNWWQAGCRYLEKAKGAEIKYRENKALFDAYKETYVDRFAASGGGVALVNAAHMAGGDPRRQDAAKNAVFFRDEANMYANLAQAAFAAVQGVGG